jgi:phosphate/phosphite/phosphonate ABC transporter binding protein
MGLVPSTTGPQDDAVLHQLQFALGRAWRVTRFGTYAALVDAIREGELELAWLPPVAYLRASRSSEVHLLLGLVRSDSASFASTLFAAAGGGITTLADLAGRHVAWVDAWSAAGYLVPRGMLRAAGLDPERLFASQTIAGSHAAVLDAVRTGLVDVGATYCSVDAQRRLVRAPWGRDPGLKAVACSEQIPGDAICAAGALPLEQARELVRPLQALAEQPATAALIAQVFGAERFTEVDAGHYAQIARVLEADLPGRGP